MYTRIWVPGSDTELDHQFEQFRIQQYNDISHQLYTNYSKETFSECAVLSITYDNNQPVICSSIIQRDCWPKNIYRILNRFWKIAEHRSVALDRSDRSTVLSKTVEAHVAYAKDQLCADLVFMSRQYDNWQKLATYNIWKKTGLEFKHDSNRYLTCDNQHDQSCWQKIVYRGNEDLLIAWKKK